VSDNRRLALVPPRYGPGVIGGAELVLQQVAHGLAGRGWDVEILTTCARDHFTWANEWPAGVTRDGAITVRRFEVQQDTSGADRRRLEAAMQQGERLTVAEQERWMNDGLRVPSLFHHLVDHAHTYRAVVVSPYPFWTTFACGQVAPERTILRPCLHDEPYARLEIFQPLFEGAAGLWLQTDPELALARRLFDLPATTEIVGEGVPVPEGYDPDAFRRKHGIDGRFLLYVGRREGGKGWEPFLEGFAQACRRRELPFQLVTMGTGDIHPPEDIADRVIDLGPLPDVDRDNALAAADAYVQPSALESFSRTVIEAWLAGTAVIANGASDVVRWHCDRSGAGLTYDDDLELEECLAFVADMPDAARELASGGREYALANYTWPVVLDRMEKTIEEWL
jgi:glycosyltransferase involved in cell wall biosynthesis